MLSISKIVVNGPVMWRFGHAELDSYTTVLCRCSKCMISFSKFMYEMTYTMKLLLICVWLILCPDFSVVYRLAECDKLESGAEFYSNETGD